MIENLKRIIKRFFFNGPKAKSIVVSIAIIGIIVTAVTITNVRKTLVINIDGKDETFVTYKGTVEDVLQEKGIEVSSKDKLKPSLETKVTENGLIKLKKAVPIEIIYDNNKLKLETAEDTIGDVLEMEKPVLKENGIEFNKDVYEISEPLKSKVQEGLSVKLVKIEVKDIVEKEIINFDTIIEKDNTLDKSVKKIKAEGANGEKEITYEVTYKGGIETSRQVKSTKTTVEPQNRIILEGTAPLYASRGELVQSNLNKGENKSFICSATAYSGDGSTASGRKLYRDINGISTISVDPSVIPLGSKVYIDGYGYAVAADTGSAVKGNKIDVYFNSYNEACRWGLKKVKLTIIAGPGEW